MSEDEWKPRQKEHQFVPFQPILGTYEIEILAD